VPDSVLWLLKQKTAFAQANLLREFEARGVEAHRICFAPFASQADHIARLRLCDIALDTFPYNSHTTGSDVLWAGVPLVTRRGETFAGRVAESLLAAHGFRELVAGSDESYFQLALDLATNTEQRAALRHRLDVARYRSPLFDTQRFTRDLEALYEAIVANHNAANENRGRVVSIS
jgi:predicted O-linked N-acetylglucosamine transferase (SPINDLY family)